MKRGVKRQTEETSDKEEKKLRINENLLRFEQMKKEAEENRARVRDEYLREQQQAKLKAADSPNDRRKTIDAVPSTRSSKPVAEAKPKSPAVSKPVKGTTPKPVKGTTPKPVKAKTPSKSPVSKKPETSVTKPSKTPSKAPSKAAPKSKPAAAAITKKASKTSLPAAVPTPPLPHLSSDDANEGGDDNQDGDDCCGQLYPSIALSDSVNAVGHLCAAFMAITNGHEIAGLGFLSVWLAAIVGVLRFGVSEKLFQQANNDLANLAAFVGYPLIGMSFAAHHYKALDINVVFLGFVLVAWEALTRSFVEANKEAAKLATNIIFFVGPIAAVCHETKDHVTMGALLAFVVAGIVITPHHENRICGVRCVDWFHLIIGVTAYMFAMGLGRA